MTNEKILSDEKIRYDLYKLDRRLLYENLEENFISYTVCGNRFVLYGLRRR